MRQERGTPLGMWGENTTFAPYRHKNSYSMETEKQPATPLPAADKGDTPQPKSPDVPPTPPRRRTGNPRARKKGKRRRPGCGLWLAALALFYVVLALLIIFNVFRCSHSDNGAPEAPLEDAQAPEAEKAGKKDATMDWFGLHLQKKDSADKEAEAEEARKAEEARRKAEEEARRRAAEGADLPVDDGLPVDGELPPSVTNRPATTTPTKPATTPAQPTQKPATQTEKTPGGEALFN